MLLTASAAAALFWEDYYRVGSLAQRVLEEALSDVIAQEVLETPGGTIETIVIR
jgi:hypothetical protein